MTIFEVHFLTEGIVSWTTLLQYRLRHYEEHENCSLGKRCAHWFSVLNFFNHPNFGMPEDDISGPEFGTIGYLDQQPTSILGAGLGGDVSRRMIQVKVQLQF